MEGALEPERFENGGAYGIIFKFCDTKSVGGGGENHAFLKSLVALVRWRSRFRRQGAQVYYTMVKILTKVLATTHIKRRHRTHRNNIIYFMVEMPE